jgi:hypothetical protein
MATTNNRQPTVATGMLADDHSELEKLIHELLGALDQENKSRSFELLDLLWARLAVHIRAEHLCLFPSILGAVRVSSTESGDSPQYDEAKRQIDLLRRDHDFFMGELGTAVNNMRKQKRSDHDVIGKHLLDVRHSVAKVKSRLDTHNQLEENHVYKWVNQLLDQEKLAALTARIRHEIENMPPRFTV